MTTLDNSLNEKLVDKWVGREKMVMYWRPYGFPAIMDPFKSQFSAAERCRGGPLIPRSRSPPPSTAHSSPSTTIQIRRSRPMRSSGRRKSASREGPRSSTSTLVTSVATTYWLVAVNADESDAMVDLIRSGLFDAVPINATAIVLGDDLFVKSPHAMIEKTRLAVEAGMKVQIAVYTDGDIDNARRFLIDSGVLPKPFSWLILPALPGCSPMYSPESMCDTLIRAVRLIRHIDPDSVIMTCAAGRASTYLATLATMLGLHVRVGMEDTVWKWPHRDDLIETNAEQFCMVRDIAGMLGRRLMPAAEYKALIAGKRSISQPLAAA